MQKHLARRIGAGRAAYLSGVSAIARGNHFCPVRRIAMAFATVIPFSRRAEVYGAMIGCMYST